MPSTRRTFVWTLAAAGGALGLVGAGRAVAADDDDGPLNLFISPCGQPFRAPRGAPYPVIDWFKQADKNGDGKLDHAEYLADAEGFFKVLDLNHDGVLGPYEIAYYEQRVAPEIIGVQYRGAALAPRRAPSRGRDDGRLWLAQMSRPGSIDPAGDAQPADPTPPHSIDESQQGASPYSFFDEPEPVAAADTDFRGVVSKAQFLAHADARFTTLDRDGAGFLTLAKLPKTPVQKRLEKKRHGFL
jgi:hypothetical protein